MIVFFFELLLTCPTTVVGRFLLTVMNTKLVGEKLHFFAREDIHCWMFRVLLGHVDTEHRIVSQTCKMFIYIIAIIVIIKLIASDTALSPRLSQ